MASRKVLGLSTIFRAKVRLTELGTWNGVDTGIEANRVIGLFPASLSQGLGQHKQIALLK